MSMTPEQMQAINLHQARQMALSLAGQRVPLTASVADLLAAARQLEAYMTGQTIAAVEPAPMPNAHPYDPPYPSFSESLPIPVEPATMPLVEQA